MLDAIFHPVPHADVSGATLTAFVLLAVFLIVGLARILGNLVARIGQPRVVGEILAGLLLGPTLLGADLSRWIAPEEIRPTLSAISTLALVLFMFLAGIEFDSSALRGNVGRATILAALSIGVPAAGGFAVAALAYTSTYVGPAADSFLPFALFVSAALTVTAFPVMAHVLMERGELNSRMGSLGVATTAIMSVLMFTYIGFATVAGTSGNFGSLILKIVAIAMFGLLSATVVRRFLVRQYAPGRELSGNSIALMFAGLVLWGLIADRIGVNALVGGFVWGMIMPADRQLRAQMAAKIKDVAMVFLLPIFFAISGFATDLKLITVETLPVLAAFLFCAVAAKFLAVVPARRFGLSWRETAYLGALLNTRGLLVLVVGLIALQAQMITVAMFTIIVVMALVTNFMTLPILNALSLEQDQILHKETSPSTEKAGAIS